MPREDPVRGLRLSEQSGAQKLHQRLFIVEPPPATPPKPAPAAAPAGSPRTHARRRLRAAKGPRTAAASGSGWTGGGRTTGAGRVATGLAVRVRIVEIPQRPAGAVRTRDPRAASCGPGAATEQLAE